jgi:CHAT domain-containing protein
VGRFREAIAADPESPDVESTVEQGRALYETLVDPVASVLEKAERILIVPDGPLHVLPFAALVSSQGERTEFLIERKPIHVVASLTVYRELRDRERTDRPDDAPTLLAFGDPRYPGPGYDADDAALRSLLVGGDSLRPLPATRDEVDAIVELFGESATGYLGPDATEDRAKQVDTGPRLLHFAAHGAIDERAPLDSAIVLTIPDPPAEGNDNGLLQAWEIFEDMRIDADLVTLSACETALGGQRAGEGMIGLTRAFQYAGAGTVLASLWEVSDRSTAELMTRFYGYLEGGKPKDEALRAAQLDLIRGEIEIDPATPEGRRGVARLAKAEGAPEYAAPFYWAAFELHGDHR